MKTFTQFLTWRENGILDVDVPDDVGEGSGLHRALTHALDKHRQETVSFLQRLASQDPDIQLELDKMNHKGGQSKKKKLRMGSASGDLDGEGDVIVPNSADSSHGEMPN